MILPLGETATNPNTFQGNPKHARRRARPSTARRHRRLTCLGFFKIVRFGTRSATPNKHRQILFAALLTVLLILCLGGCGGNPNHELPTQPDHASHIPLPEGSPVSWEEYVRTVKELDSTRAENSRLDMERQAAIEEKRAANVATWKRFGSISWAFIAPGLGLLVFSFLPFASFLAPARNLGFLLLGLGAIFAAAPWILSEFGSYALLPIFLTAGGYVFALGAIDIVRRVRRVAVEAKVAAAALDPDQPDVDAPNLIATKVENDPAFAAALTKEVGAAAVEALPATGDA